MYQKQGTGSNLYPAAVDMLISSPPLSRTLHPASPTPLPPKTRGTLWAVEGASRGVKRHRKSEGRARGAHALGRWVSAGGRRGLGERGAG